MAVSAALGRWRPRRLHRIAHAAREALRRGVFRWRLALRGLRVPRGRIAVSYAGVLARAGSGVVHGGRVKLLHLMERFPESADDFNLVYLVSSARPEFAAVLVRWARSRGARFVWNQNGVAYPAWAGADYARINAPMREMLGLADYVIYQSEFCRASADRYVGRASARSEILYNCVDTEVFSPRKEPLAGPPWVILVAGSHQQAERVTSALETVALLRGAGQDVRLTIAGRLEWEGAEREFETTVRRLEIERFVSRRGFFAQADAPELYRGAHVLLHTKYKDPCPTVVIEAMACGVPVVGARSGGMPELVGDEGGVLLDVADSWERMCYPSAPELSDAILHILSDLDTWRGRARQRAVRMFGKDAWVQRHAEIFTALLNESEDIGNRVRAG